LLLRRELTTFGAVNLVIFLFNLVPIPPLDGGNILTCLLKQAKRPVPVFQIRLVFAMLFWVPIFIFGIFVLIRYHNVSLVITCLYLLMKVVFEDTL
jgi:membrane-associated protease RseP (regulator of RpoE activity)